MKKFEERWIKGFECLYSVCSNGDIISYKKGIRKILKPRKHRQGYIIYSLTDKNGKLFSNLLGHRLVAETFLSNASNKPCVNHKNGIKTDNQIDNLEWTTYSENNLHARNLGLNKGYSRKIVQLDMTGNMIKEWPSITNASKSFTNPASIGNIMSCCSGRRKSAYGYKWRYLY